MNIGVFIGRKGMGMDLFATVLAFKMRQYFGDRCIGRGDSEMKGDALWASPYIADYGRDYNSAGVQEFPEPSSDVARIKLEGMNG